MKLADLRLVNAERDATGRLTACFLAPGIAKKEVRRVSSDPAFQGVRSRLRVSNEELADVLAYADLVSEIAAMYPSVCFWTSSVDATGPIAAECLTFDTVRSTLDDATILPTNTHFMPDSNGGFMEVPEGLGSCYLVAPRRDQWPDLVAGMVLPRSTFSAVVLFAKEPRDLEQIHDRVRGLTVQADFALAMDAMFPASLVYDMDEDQFVLATTDEELGRRIFSGRTLDWVASIGKL